MNASANASRAGTKGPTALAPIDAAPSAQCDLCEAPMTLPLGAIRDGRIIGLITCSACVEDALAARQLEEVA